MRYLALIFATFFFISCSSKDENLSKNTNNKKPNLLKKYQKQVPNWVMNPNIGVKYGAVGIAEYQKNKRLQRLRAIANGKRKLSEQFRLQLQKRTPMPLNTDSKLIGSTFNIVALESSENITKNATIKASYIDQRGTLYLWVVIY